MFSLMYNKSDTGHVKVMLHHSKFNSLKISQKKKTTTYMSNPCQQKLENRT